MAETFGGGYWITAPHHKIIEWEAINLLRDKTLDGLIIKAPPRHGKSEYLARWFLAWYMLHNPRRRVMLCSNTASLAKHNSRWVRDRFHQLAPLVKLRGVNQENASVDDWSIEGPAMGGMMAAGIGSGSFTGRGADLIAIDDYLRNAADAQSETIRNKTWEWFTATISTRREPKGKILLLCTQWNSDDLIGRIQKKKEELGLNIRCVTLQALREVNGTPDPLGRQPGEALWPGRFPAVVLEKQRSIMGPYWWSCQYQGRPITRDGAIFPEAYFSNIYCGDDEWHEDFAVSAAYLDPSKGKDSKKGDYQAMVFVGLKEGKLWVRSDIDRRPIPELMRAYAHFCQRLRPSFVGIEANAFQELLGPEWLAACAELDYHATEPSLITNTAAKGYRIERLGSWFSNRELVFVKNASNETLISQTKNFPFGKHDDGPDALEGAIRLLCQSVDGLSHRAEPEMTRIEA